MHFIIMFFGMWIYGIIVEPDTWPLSLISLLIQILIMSRLLRNNYVSIILVSALSEPFLRSIADGMQGCLPYFWRRDFAEMLLMLFMVLALVCIWHVLVGYNTGRKKLVGIVLLANGCNVASNIVLFTILETIYRHRGMIQMAG